MSEQEKACARACLRGVEVDMAELRASESWWLSLSDERRRQFMEFGEMVVGCLIALKR